MWLWLPCEWECECDGDDEPFDDDVDEELSDLVVVDPLELELSDEELDDELSEPFEALVLPRLSVL